MKAWSLHGNTLCFLSVSLLHLFILLSNFEAVLWLHVNTRRGLLDIAFQTDTVSVINLSLDCILALETLTASHISHFNDSLSFISLSILIHVVWLSEASAKTRDGVQCAFEELVEKILQTPGLWESSIQGHGVQLSDHEHQHQGACGGYCSLI